MSVLGQSRLLSLLRNPEPNERLIVTPLLNPRQVAEASIDIRLGHDFIVTRRGNLSSVDPANEDNRSRSHLSKHHVNFQSKFHLHPNELVLANTLEYFKLPLAVAATVTSRSSWGRTGLVIATATAVQPGFSGTITLELVNLGEVPLVLYPGLSIAQMIFFDCVGASEYAGKFSHQVEPGRGNVTDERQADLRFWTR